MVGHRRQRNVHQTAGKVSWLDGRLSGQVDTAGIRRSSHVAASPSRRQRQGKRDNLSRVRKLYLEIYLCCSR